MGATATATARLQMDCVGSIKGTISYTLMTLIENNCMIPIVLDHHVYIARTAVAIECITWFFPKTPGCKFWMVAVVLILMGSI